MVNPSEKNKALCQEWAPRSAGESCVKPGPCQNAFKHQHTDTHTHTHKHTHTCTYMYVVVQSLSCVWLFVIPWTTAHQASLSFTLSRSLLKLMSIESLMPSSHLTLCCPLLLLCLSQHQSLFQWVSSLHQVAKVLKLQHQSFQWIFRVDFLTEYLFYARYGTNHFLYINLIFIRILWRRYS